MKEQAIQIAAVEEFNKLKGEATKAIKSGITDFKVLMKEVGKEIKDVEKQFEAIAAAVEETLKEMACTWVLHEIDGVNYLINMLFKNNKSQTRSETLDKQTNT
jgi:hypothetical protein